jgi:hypothetical protein
MILILNWHTTLKKGPLLKTKALFLLITAESAAEAGVPAQLVHWMPSRDFKTVDGSESVNFSHNEFFQTHADWVRFSHYNGRLPRLRISSAKGSSLEKSVFTCSLFQNISRLSTPPRWHVPSQPLSILLSFTFSFYPPIFYATVRW